MAVVFDGRYWRVSIEPERDGTLDTNNYFIDSGIVVTGLGLFKR